MDIAPSPSPGCLLVLGLKNRKANGMTVIKPISRTRYVVRNTEYHDGLGKGQKVSHSGIEHHGQPLEEYSLGWFGLGIGCQLV